MPVTSLLRRFPLWIEANSRLLSYCKLNREATTNNLQYDAFLVQHDLNERNIPCWLSNVSKILAESGYTCILLTTVLILNQFSLVFASAVLRQRLKDIFLEIFY